MKDIFILYKEIFRNDVFEQIELVDQAFDSILPCNSILSKLEHKENSTKMNNFKIIDFFDNNKGSCLCVAKKLSYEKLDSEDMADLIEMRYYIKKLKLHEM